MQGEVEQVRTSKEIRLDLGIYKAVQNVADSKDIDSKQRCLVVIGAIHVAALGAVGVAHVTNLFPYVALVASLVIQTAGVIFIKSSNAKKQRSAEDKIESGASGRSAGKT